MAKYNVTCRVCLGLLVLLLLQGAVPMTLQQGGGDDNSTWCDTVAELARGTHVLERRDLLNVSVEHSQFATEHGLLDGLVYRVAVSKSASSMKQLAEFSLLSLVDDRPSGQFVSQWEAELCPGEEWAVAGRLATRASVAFNWSVDAASLVHGPRPNVTFRLRFRLGAGVPVRETRLVLPLLTECRLQLRQPVANISWRVLPPRRPDCWLVFPAGQGERRGLVVELTRLNVPCPAGGFLQFFPSDGGRTRHQPLCGKLEELPLSGRRLYFPSPPPSVHLHGAPVFAFTYRLVDYCYNVTLTAQNDSIVLTPTAGLHCTFTIHLPYGNRVRVSVQVGADSAEHELPQLASSAPDPPCQGLLTRLWDGAASWAHCSRSDQPQRRFSVLSLGNSVTLRVVVPAIAAVPAMRLWYSADAVPEVVQQCAFGWVAVRQFCVAVVDDMRATWRDAEQDCVRRGGHLASIRSEQAQAAIDNLLLYSPGYRDHNSYWVGASDKTYEGDFRWSNGLPFHYTNWFPGWSHHDHYSKQPNDDGVSEQDCVELRRVYPLPSASFRLAHSFMWNDMDCTTLNFFLCERLRTGEPAEEGWSRECNRSVVLSREQPRATVVSPGFPRRYPDNAECNTEILAPPGYRLVLDFEELVLEEERDCSYDFLEISEGSEGPSRLCGDWSAKLKLQRHKSRGPRLRMRFVSDYSHHYGGFKARVSMENAVMECADDRFEMFNSSCYLFVGHPEVTWQTAQQTCRDKKAELASIQSSEEEMFVTAHIRKLAEYTTSAIYWLGGQKSVHTSLWEWVDGVPMIFSAWPPRHAADVQDHSESLVASCLGVQWLSSSTPLFSSGLYWQPQQCSTVGGYVCKRVNQSSTLYLNRTINGSEGFLTSQNYPSNYNHNLDYWVKLVGPDRTRLVVQFTKIDLEPQHECLYDYVELRTSGPLLVHDVIRWCGSHDTDMDRFNFVSESNKAVLRFHSDYSLSGNGFSASWKAVDVSGCPLLTLTAREGLLVSPNYPHFLMAHLDCATTILAPVGRKVWIEFMDFDLGSHGSWRGFPGDVPEAEVELDLGTGTSAFRPFQLAAHLTDGAFLSAAERLQVRLRTANWPRGIGFKATYRTVNQAREERILDLGNITVGTLLHLNYPSAAPPHLDFVQHLIAPPGNVILLELHHVTVSENTACPNREGSIEVVDNYADTNGTWWFLCESKNDLGMSVPLAIASYLNTLHVRQRSELKGVQLNATIRVQPDVAYKRKLLLSADDGTVESCHPNPCQNGGKCLTVGLRRSCQCTSHFTGMFCALTLCELEPCVFGECRLTHTSYTCHCQPGYTGINCEQKQRPCAENPCEGRGDCVERSDTFYCQCHAWMEGPKCERRMMHIPFKPLSERMLQEPFWLGLITVTVVLGVIGLVWCAKRHLPEKLEKLLAEEADRNRTGGSSHSRPPSVREQLAASGTTVVVVPSPQPGCPRSLFGRLGIRKPSLLSLTSPHGISNHPSTATARTFSLDDLLKPPPRRTPSPRKKRNNSTPTKKNIAEKKKILQQLIGPSTNQQRPRKVSLGELIQLSERKLKESNDQMPGAGLVEDEEKETTFSDAANTSQLPAASSASRSSIDAKLEKKVTFARLLSKVSAEMSSGSELELGVTGPVATRHPQLSGLPRSSSTPPSPAADPRSPHSTSSNQGSDSMSSLDVGGTAVSDMLARRPCRLLQGGRPMKNTSADSILAMFRNFSSATAGPTNKLSPSTTPTASSPQDDPVGSDESTTSSVPTPQSSSSFTLDSPPMPHAFHRHTIEVPVLDALSAQRTAGGGSNLLHPPTILLEIPSGGISKCLSPIREVPTPLATPLPSPSLTPIMPRSTQVQQAQLPSITITGSDQEDEEAEENDTHIQQDTDEEDVVASVMPFKFKACPPSMRDLTAASTVDDCSGSEAGCCSPLPPVIPVLTVQQPSPTHHCPQLLFPGSPPPQRGGGLMEVGLTFAGKAPRRLLKELDKPNSLDLPCPPPLITVTSNMSEAESDTESISPATKTSGTHPGVAVGGVGMCYLSPFSMCSRADRTASESNLSSSGYSSMASPGPSRCGSNNPLCPSEMEDPPGPNSGPGSGPTTLQAQQAAQRRPSPLLRTPTTTQEPQHAEGEGRRPPEPHTLQGGHCRGRSDSETLSDDLFVESNDEGIGTDHLDDKIEEGELKSAKELEVFIGKELLENGKTLLGLSMMPPPPVATARGGTKFVSMEASLDSCKLLPLSQTLCKASLQLPAIVVQVDPSCCDKHLSPVSSRSESPLSDKTAGLGRFSPMFYGRHKCEQPFTDSDGLYDCPSSDCPLNRTPLGGAPAPQHRKSTGRRRERRAAGQRLGGGSCSPVHLLDVPGKEQILRPVAPRKPSPKRSRIRTQHLVSSSSSSESINSTREIVLAPKPLVPKHVCWTTGISVPEDEWVSDTKGRRLSIEASGEDTGEDAASHMLPKTMTRDDLPKPHKKISRLRTIGHQIRFLRRLELSLKRRERLVSPSDSCGDEEGCKLSPPLLSPLLELHKSNSFGQLQSESHGRHHMTKQKRLPRELLIPHEKHAWRPIRVMGSSGHTD